MVNKGSRDIQFSQMYAIIPIVKKIPATTPKVATSHQKPGRPIHPAIAKATNMTTQVPDALKQNSEISILLQYCFHYYSSICLKCLITILTTSNSFAMHTKKSPKPNLAKTVLTINILNFIWHYNM
jgi:hypothetical protein